MLRTDLLQALDFPAGVLDPAAQAAILRHALLHVLNVDVLLHADIFLHEVFQLDVHAERNGTLEQKRELFRIQTA